MVAQCVQNHTAWICDRGAQTRIGQLLDLSSVRWDRRRDDTSQGEVVIQGDACSRQADLLRNIEPKRHELVLYRGEDRVWEGPVNRVGWHSDRVRVVARDIMEYLHARPLSKEWDNSYKRSAGPTPDPDDDIIVDDTTQTTTRLQNILNYELANPFTITTGSGSRVIPAWESLTPPANVLPHVQIHQHPNEVRTSAKTLPFQYMVGEHLDNYAHTGGIDYTVVGRALHIWDTSNPLGTGRLLTEADFYGEVIVTAYGSDLAVFGLAVAHDGTFGGAGQNDAFYGPWGKLFTVYDEDENDVPTVAELRSQAQRNIAGRNPVPVEVRVPDNSSIRLSNGLTIQDLVPGAYFPLLATLNARQVSQVQKLHQVVVNETGEGETIQVTFVPSTRADDDIVEV